MPIGNICYLMTSGAHLGFRHIFQVDVFSNRCCVKVSIDFYSNPFCGEKYSMTASGNIVLSSLRQKQIEIILISGGV